MKKNEQLLIPSVKRIIYGSTFLLGLSMSNIIEIPVISPETAFAGTLIPNVTATASSYVDPYSPNRAVDSDATHGYSRWYCTGTDKYLILDLKKSYKIDRWVVENLGTLGWSADNNASDYKLLGSIDGNSWTVIDTVSGNTENSTDKNISNPVLARYVKLEVTKGNQYNNNWTSIAEFNVYAAPASISSVSLPASRTYTVGETLSFTVNFDGNVTLSGSNSGLDLTVGNQVRQARFVSKTANSITYSYTVQSGDSDSDGIAISALNLNGDSLKDSFNSDVDTTLNNIGDTSGILVKCPYRINISPLTGGSISTVPSGNVYPNTNVTVNATPNTGMRLKENTLKYNDGEDHLITGNTFVMANNNVTISAEFERMPLTISTDLADESTVKSGKNVILTAEDGAIIYYTTGTDLSEPADPNTDSSSISSGQPISITGAPGDIVKIKAYAVKTGVPSSQVYEFTYNIEAVTPAVNSVQVTPASVSVVQGESSQLTATIDAVGGADNGISWTSSDTTNKVTVDGTGKVSVAADAIPGEYTITAESVFDGTKKGTSEIIVTTSSMPVTPAVNSVEVTPASVSIVQGESSQLTANVDAVGGADNGISWTSSDTTNKVTVDGTGKVSVAADAIPGEYTITAESVFDGTKKGISRITVTTSSMPVTPAVNSVQVTPASVSVVQGESSQLTANVDAVGGADDRANWTSSDTTNKVTVDGTGKVSVAADAIPGDYIITAESVFDRTKKATSIITVTAATPANGNTAIKIVSQPSDQTVRKGNTATFNINVEGIGPFNYKWKKDGEALIDSDNISGSKKSTLIIRDARKSDEGEYSCIIADGIGNVTTSSAVTLMVTSRTTNNNDSNYSTNNSDNSSAKSSNNSGTITININGEEANSIQNSDKLINAIKSENINTIIVDINKIRAGEGVPQNETNATGGANPPLLSEDILTSLKTNINKTLVIKNGDIAIELKSNLEGQIQFTQNNTPITGFVTIGNTQYYSNQNGVMQTGWIQTAENVYYHFNTATGADEKGWIKDVDGAWYYLDTTSGIMKTGWLNDNGISYYLKNTGSMATGWLQDANGEWYYFYQNGAMAKNAEVDGYNVGDDGSWIQ